MAKDMNVRGVFFVRRPGGRFARRASPPGPAPAMAWLGLALIALATPLEPALAASGRISIESGGITRTATLILHRRLKQARRPLVIVLRGSHEKGGRLKQNFAFEEMAESAGQVLVYPEPVGGHWSAAPGVEAVRDVTFIRDLIAKLVSDGLVDRRKVFIVGVSSGGLAAFRVACDNTALLAGAAMLVTAMPADLAATCKPMRPLPFMMIVGTADQLIPYAGGLTNLPDAKISVASTDAALAIFGKAAGCGEGRSTTPLPDRDPHDGTRVYLEKLNGCKVPVEAFRVEGGGHSVPGHWGPGGSPRSGPHNNDVEGARLVWEFFRRLGV